MQFLIQSLKLSLTTSLAKLAHWVLKLKTICRISALKKKNVLPTTVSTIPPWLLKRPNCNFSLCCYDKATTNPEVFKRKFFELRSEFSHHIEIYTDGFKDEIRTTAGVVAPNSVKTVRLPDNASIFTAEIQALVMALDIIRRTRSKDYVVFSDTLSSLQGIESCKVKNPLILKIMKDHNQLINSGKSITFCWIPSHVGIRGNEDADIAAKTGLDVTTTNMRFPVSDLLTCVNQ